MSDRKTIYLDDAIEAICKACSMEEDYHKCDGYPKTSTWCDCLVALRALQSAQQWIPCSERLPEVDEPVLVTDDSGGIKTVDVDRCGQYENSNERFWYYTQNAVAWMPLPEPYTERWGK